LVISQYFNDRMDRGLILIDREDYGLVFLLLALTVMYYQKEHFIF